MIHPVVVKTFVKPQMSTLWWDQRKRQSQQATSSGDHQGQVQNFAPVKNTCGWIFTILILHLLYVLWSVIYQYFLCKFTHPQLCLLLLNLCIRATTAYPVDLYALTVAGPSRKAGAALLILFYLRAPLNINVVFSLNYSLTALPILSAFVQLPPFLSSTFPLYLPSPLLVQSFHPEG